METFWDYVSYEMIIMLLLNCMHDVRMIEFMSGVCTGLAGSGDCQSTAHSFIVYKSIRMNLVTQCHTLSYNVGIYDRLYDMQLILQYCHCMIKIYKYN